jgi:RNA polymerase sigma-70 factor (ECF subfamily)
VTLDENSLAAQAAQDPSCFTQIYTQWYPRVFNYISYRTPEGDEVEDLVMQVFEKVLKNIRRFDPQKGPFGAWLFAIARNVVNDYHRARKFSWLPFSAYHDRAAPASSLEDSIVHTDDQRQLLQALAKLSRREQDILGLKFAARLTNRQIAAEVGLSESSVGVIIYRSLIKLRSHLQDSRIVPADQAGRGLYGRR